MQVEEKFLFTSQAKKSIFITIAVGIVLLLIGAYLLQSAGHGHGHDGHGAAAAVEQVSDHEGAQEHDAHGHGAAHWSLRLKKNLWHNSVFFTGIAVIGLFFVCFNYIAQAGWSAALKRVPESFGYYIPVAFITIVVTFFLFRHDLFHWYHDELYDPNSPAYDPIIASKTWYLGKGFYIFRMFAYFGLWFGIWWVIRKNSLAEDLEPNLKYHDSSIFWSAIFLVVWGITSSTSAWDWVMSIDPHFFSTMFGWYVFASWFVSGLAAIALIVVFLKDRGYLAVVNENHLHDLGKFVFAFSIFWTYIWFAQFLLIYYANIPEESYYFVERLKSDVYSPIFFMNIFINFLFPFLLLMTRNAKRQSIILKIVCIAILFGHWMDFYIMMTPGLLGQAGGLDGIFFFVELGMAMIFVSMFTFMVLTGLSRASLVPRNHPMLGESLHHHVY